MVKDIKKWSEMNKKEKTVSVVKVIMVILLAAALIVLLFSREIFGEDSIFAEAIGTSDKPLSEILKNAAPTIITCAIQILVVLIISWLLRLILSKLFMRSKRSKTVIRLLNSIIKYTSGIIIIFMVLAALGANMSTLLASAGVLSLIVGLGAQSLIADIISGLFLIFENTFEVGDIIVLDGYRGEVIELGVRSTKLIDTGGNVKIINNSNIDNVVNLTSELSIAVCDVGIEYGAPLEKIEKILYTQLSGIKSELPSIIEAPEYKGVQSLSDSAVVLRIIGKCREEDKYQAGRELNRAIKLLFDRNGINIPFPQVVTHKGAEDSPTVLKAVKLPVMPVTAVHQVTEVAKPTSLKTRYFGFWHSDKQTVENKAQNEKKESESKKTVKPQLKAALQPKGKKAAAKTVTDKDGKAKTASEKQGGEKENHNIGKEKNSEVIKKTTLAKKSTKTEKNETAKKK